MLRRPSGLHTYRFDKLKRPNLIHGTLSLAHHDISNHLLLDRHILRVCFEQILPQHVFGFELFDRFFSQRCIVSDLNVVEAFI